MQLEGEIFTQHEAKVGADTNPSRYGCRSVRGVQVCGCGCINCHAITASVSIADWCCMLILLHTVCACTPAIADARLSKATHVLCVTISDHLAASWVRHISIFYLLISFPSCTIARRKSWQPHSPALLSLSLSLSLSFARSLSHSRAHYRSLARTISLSLSIPRALSCRRHSYYCTLMPAIRMALINIINMLVTSCKPLSLSRHYDSSV